jgi:hypothetical protein
MHQSLQLDDHPQSDELSANSGHFHSSNRGYRKRGSYFRGRGGTYHRRNSGSSQWKPKVKEELVDSHSLLSRLESDSSSLLNRLSPPKDGLSSPVSSTSLAERISGAVDEEAYSQGGSLARRADSVASPRTKFPRRASSSMNEVLVCTAHLSTANCCLT